MNKKFILVLEITVALIALLTGYVLIVGQSAIEPPAKANTSAAPDESHILYLASEGAERGQVNDQVMRNRGATPVRSWQAVREADNERSLDALLIDTTLFETMTEADRAWLQHRFRNGMVTVSLGINEAQFAQHLGLQTLRSAGETGAPTDNPTGYMIVSSLILGQPEDLTKLEEANWLDQKIQRDTVKPVVAPDDIKHPTVTKFSKARGTLDSDDDIDFLFERLKLKIEGINQTRQEYQDAVKNFEEE